MPLLGINAVVLPLIGHLYLDGVTGALNVYSALQDYPWWLILQFGSYLLAIGIVIFNWVIWRNEILSKWGSRSLFGWLGFVFIFEQSSFKTWTTLHWIINRVGWNCISKSSLDSSSASIHTDN